MRSHSWAEALQRIVAQRADAEETRLFLAECELLPKVRCGLLWPSIQDPARCRTNTLGLGSGHLAPDTTLTAHTLHLNVCCVALSRVVLLCLLVKGQALFFESCL